MILTNSYKEQFLKDNAFVVQMLPNWAKNLIIIRWFNTKTNIAIDIQNWGNDGFDFAVQDPYVNKVYLSNKTTGNRIKNYDEIIEQALKVANSIYNGKVY